MREYLAAVCCLVLLGGCGTTVLNGQDVSLPAAPAAAATPAVAPAAAVEADTATDEREWVELEGREYTVSRSENFLILHNDDAEWANRTARLLELTRHRFYETLEEAGFTVQRNASRLVWIGFTDAEQLRGYALQADRMNSRTLEAYYSTRTNRVAALFPTGENATRERPWLAQTSELREDVAMLVLASLDEPIETQPGWRIDVAQTTHELGHQLAFNSGLQARGVMYPFWLSEGLATNFEADDSGVAGFGKDNAVRRGRLWRMHNGGRTVPMQRLILLTHMPNDIEAKDLYAQSWGLFHYLFTQRTEELRQYMGLLANARHGRRSDFELFREFTSVFGPMNEFQREWQRYLDTLQTRPQPPRYLAQATEN